MAKAKKESEGRRDRGPVLGQRRQRFVQPRSDGTWEVTGPHTVEASAVEPTAAAATERAMQIVQKAGGGDVVVHAADGEVRESITVRVPSDALDLQANKGVALDRQVFSWRELGGVPFSKLDSDAFTRVRVNLMNAVESQQNRFLHALAQMNADLRLPAARVRRIEQHQQSFVNFLNPADQGPLETTIGIEQLAIEVTAAVARVEPDPYLAQVYRFGLVEDFDHMFRFSALMDRLEARDANDILQSYTDIMPGRPTSVEHRAPVDDLRTPYDRSSADVLSKLHARTILAAKAQARDYYLTIGPMFSDPLARQLYAEIASIEEQHVTQYESLIAPDETWLEKWLMHELDEAYNYWSCFVAERDVRIKKTWERFLDYELGQLHFVAGLMTEHERRDPFELIPEVLPEPIAFRSHRDFVRAVLASEATLTAVGPDIGAQPDSGNTLAYRERMGAAGSPSDAVSAGWHWRPGGELSRDALDIAGPHKAMRRASA